MQEKSKLKWHLEGGRNTSYFHKVTKIRNTTKHITSIKDGGNTIIDPILIANHALNFYKSLFCTNIVLQDSLLMEEVIPNLVSDNTNQMLTMLPTSQEIHRAVFALNKDSPLARWVWSCLLSNFVGYHKDKCGESSVAVFYFWIDHAKLQLKNYCFNSKDT